MIKENQLRNLAVVLLLLIAILLLWVFSVNPVKAQTVLLKDTTVTRMHIKDADTVVLINVEAEQIKITGDGSLIYAKNFQSINNDTVGLWIRNSKPGAPGYRRIVIDSAKSENTMGLFNIRGGHDLVLLRNVDFSDPYGLYGPHYNDVTAEISFDGRRRLTAPDTLPDFIREIPVELRDQYAEYYRLDDWIDTLIVQNFRSTFGVSGSLFFQAVRHVYLENLIFDRLYTYIDSLGHEQPVQRNGNNGGSAVKGDYFDPKVYQPSSPIFVNGLYVYNSNKKSTVPMRTSIWFQEIIGNAVLMNYDVDLGIVSKGNLIIKRGSQGVIMGAPGINKEVD